MNRQHHSLSVAWMAAAAWLAIPAVAVAQGTYGAEPIPGVRSGGSRNIKVQSHIPMAAPGITTGSVGDIDVEQELSRPYVYVARRLKPSGFDIVSVKDPQKAYVLYSWRIENADLHQGAGSLNPMLVKTKGRYYLTTAYQFRQGGPDADVGAIVHDVTGLPDTTKIKEVARIKETVYNQGFHETFAYKHSSGAALLVATTGGPWANVYDMDKVVAGGDPNGWLVGKIERPDSMADNRFRGYHDFYVAYDPANKRDVFYGAGLTGFYVFDITDLKNPKMLTSITGAAGANFLAHTFVVDPTGRYAMTENEYQYAPLRMWDLKPGLDGTVKTISRPIGAWIPQWNSLPHNIEMRWPYAFVSDYEDGLQVVNIMDPTNPYTVGYYYSCECPHPQGLDQNGFNRGAGLVGGENGTWGVDIRNADGLIVASDMQTGFWAFKMEGFDGWNGHQWGLPNVSSAQDWDNGPDGAPKPGRVS